MSLPTTQNRKPYERSAYATLKVGGKNWMSWMFCWKNGKTMEIGFVLGGKL